MLYVRACQRGLRAKVPAWFTCQRPKSVPTFHFYVPMNVSMCHKACQFFKRSSYELLREISLLNYYTYYATIILDIIVTRIIYIYSILSFFLSKTNNIKTKTNSEYLIKKHMVLI